LDELTPPLMTSLHLISPPNDQKQEAKPTAVNNLLDHFDLMHVYDAFSQSSSKTFKSYIRHLPGDFHVSKQGRVDPAGSLKIILENAPPPEYSKPIEFRPISERQLQAAFTLQDGGYKKKKKKHSKSKRDKENGTVGLEEKKHKKKKRNRDVETPETEPKKKKKKKDKTSPPPKTTTPPQVSISPPTVGLFRRL